MRTSGVKSAHELVSYQNQRLVGKSPRTVKSLYTYGTYNTMYVYSRWLLRNRFETRSPADTHLCVCTCVRVHVYKWKCLHVCARSAGGQPLVEIRRRSEWMFIILYFFWFRPNIRAPYSNHRPLQSCSCTATGKF